MKLEKVRATEAQKWMSIKRDYLELQIIRLFLFHAPVGDQAVISWGNVSRNKIFILKTTASSTVWLEISISSWVNVHKSDTELPATIHSVYADTKGKVSEIVQFVPEWFLIENTPCRKLSARHDVWLKALKKICKYGCAVIYNLKDRKNCKRKMIFTPVSGSYWLEQKIKKNWKIKFERGKVPFRWSFSLVSHWFSTMCPRCVCLLSLL